MILSFSNPLVKRIKRLKQKKHRLSEGVGYVEGLRPVLTCIESAIDLIEVAVYAPGYLKSEAGLAAVTRLTKAGIRCEATSTDVFASFSDRENPIGIGAIVRNPARPLSGMTVTEQSIFVMLEDISDPGNLGTILRGCDAAGASGLILVGKGVDLTHPTALKASMGTAFTVPTAQMDAYSDVNEWASANGIRQVGTSAKAVHSYWAVEYPSPVILLMGNEQRGLSQPIQDAADELIQVPMHGTASSLNVAMATTVCLYEIRRKMRD